jgi:hypothetical protein
MSEFKELMASIEAAVEKHIVTANFSDEWQEHALKNLTLEQAVNIAWVQGRKAILLEIALMPALGHVKKCHSQVICRADNEDICQACPMYK